MARVSFESILIICVFLCACSSARPSFVPAEPAFADRYFEDVSLAAGLAFAHTPADGDASLPDRVAGGVCVLSVSGGAPHDLFFALRRGLDAGSRLFVATSPLRYVDETSTRGLAGVGDAVGCLAFDADRDGDDDLLITEVGGVSLYLNQDGHFVEALGVLPDAPSPFAVYAGAAAGDVDGDGDLDVVVAGYVDADARPLADDCRGLPCAVLVQEYAALPNLLLLRGDDGVYVDASASLAPDLAAREPTLVVALIDLDADGSLDLFVGNDLGDSYFNRALVRDTSGVYRDAAERLGLARDSRGNGIDTMGFSAADIDGDGSLDFALSAFEGWPSPIYRCVPPAPCEELSSSIGTNLRADSFRWGNALADFDLDGDIDLFEATGHVFTDAEGRAVGFSFASAQRPNLYLGDVGRLNAVEPIDADALAQTWPARGVALADLDDDGRPDLVLATTRGSPALLHNVRAPVGRALRVELADVQPGDAVRVDDGTRHQLRVRTSGDGYLGSSDPRFLFAVDPGAHSVRVEVTRLGQAAISYDVRGDRLRVP